MRRYFMVNGPLGGNMGTPPVEPQPPQVSFTTTAESRGGFNNFLKSIPQTTAMTPIPPLGSAPTAPMSNPMGNIDIFNQPPSMGMGMMGMNQPQMQQPMQPPMNMGVGLMGTPIQSFFDGGQVDDFGDFSSAGDFSVGDTEDRSESDNFQDALDQAVDQASQFGDGQDSINVFSDDPAVVDRRGINVGLENTGGFTAGVVPNLRGERFARFESVPFAQRALGRDFQTKIRNNPNLTAGDYFETFTPSSENPGGTGNRMAEFTTATGKGPNDILSINDMNNIMDIQGKYEAGIRNNPAGQIEKISTTVPMNDDKQIASILDNLDLSKNLALNKEPEAFDMFGNPMSTLTNQPGVSISNRAMQQMVDNDLADRAFSKGNFSMIGPADPDMDALERSIANTQRANEIQNRLANVNDQTLSDRLQNQRGLDRNISITPDTALETMIDRRDIFQPDNIGTGQQRVDTSLENMAGRRDVLPDQVFDINTNVVDRNPDLDALRSRGTPVDTIFDIDTTDTRNFVGDDAFDDSTFIENPSNMVEAGVPSILAPKEFKDPFPNAGIGSIPTLTSLANKFSAYSRGRVLDSIAQKGYTPVYDGDVIVGAKNKSGQLMEGMDPNAPMDTGNDNNENPLILRPIAKAEEEEKEEEKLPNVIGGGETPAPVSSGSVVVDSPFTSNVGNFIPSSFNTGELNKLIEALTGVASPRAMKQGGVARYAEGGRVMQALDNLLATG